MSAVNDGRCSPWVMCSCSVVSGNQIRDKYVYVYCIYLLSRLYISTHTFGIYFEHIYVYAFMYLYILYYI